ncbi:MULTISPECIES: methionine ABC transporter permease [Embleya]|uniref:Metal ABC transporter permease n=2 Tax=Embleya TaxID=2699295 RepID=A0A1T3P5K9_9ACTN|nr:MULTISPECIES: methionine ABC transporter permease [Embleya]OPC84344.1 metal ABC transporter permease [Embleya scabrispora]GCD93862.1 ABC transporter permease [Embleya hyalina]
MTWSEMRPLLETATQETLYMVGVATLITVLIGLPIGLLLVLTDRGGPLSFAPANKLLGLVVNVGRSIPFLILLVALIPFTRWVTGTTIGTDAAIVPLTVGAIPFFARLVETAVREVDRGLIEAAQSMGAGTFTVVRKVLVREAVPSIISAITVTVVAIVGYSAMAGVVGGGGLGDLAIRYGYQRFETNLMLVTIAVLVVLVQLVQFLGDLLSRRLAHR